MGLGEHELIMYCFGRPLLHFLMSQLTSSSAALRAVGVRATSLVSDAAAAADTPGTPGAAAPVARQKRTRNPIDQRKITMRDLLFYLEHDPHTARSRLLAKRYMLLRER